MSLIDNADSAAIVHAIVGLGESLNLPITAEGIETPTILTKLKTMGELKGQGYYYGRPETAEAVRARLASLGLLARSDTQAETGESAEEQLKAG